MYGEQISGRFSCYYPQIRLINGRIRQLSLTFSLYIVKDQLPCSLFRFFVLIEDSADFSNVSSHVHLNSQLAQPELLTTYRKTIIISRLGLIIFYLNVISLILFNAGWSNA